jgi:type II secretory pathway predicted ATPase ExeA/septal ring-binding cell division protein DamX
MYLEHFGLKEPPFKITPVTDFFFPGANRAEILDALLYAISESEGIIKVTGEVGSGKTMLCRMLLERFPEKIEAVYLANPSLSREEMLYAIADGLSLNLEGQRVNIILKTLQNHLELKLAQGKRVVILVDEAHAMPLDTMEELRLLYNLQIGNHKLLHIVLVGQPELNEKLSQPNMRQLKDRILHHFSMLPLSQNIIESYLLFRMRTAGYRGPSPFSIQAAALIGKASQGLMRRVNILADKSLLAAFISNTHGVEVSHVQAAIRDTELGELSQAWWKNKKTIIVASVTLAAAIIIAVVAWLLGGIHAQQSNSGRTSTASRSPNTSPSAALPATSDIATATPLTIEPQNFNDGREVKLLMTPTLHSTPNNQFTTVTEAEPVVAKPQVTQLTNSGKAAESPVSATDAVQETLLEQRLAAAKTELSQSPAGSASIQLYYTDHVKPARIEAFLKRADGQGVLKNIYVLPIKINGRKGFRVLYGIYANNEKARSGIRQLPQRFQDAFAPTIYLIDNSPAT